MEVIVAVYCTAAQIWAIEEYVRYDYYVGCLIELWS